MQIHQIQPKNKQRTANRVGRGGKRGTYSGRGMKGQKSRSGARFQPKVREILKRYPKLRGYKRSVYGAVSTVNIRVLESNFQSGDVVNPKSLMAKDLIIATTGKKTLSMKILGSGELTKRLIVEKCLVSALAKKKIETVGGTVT